jgi:hypothetical protein
VDEEETVVLSEPVPVVVSTGVVVGEAVGDGVGDVIMLPFSSTVE